MATITTTATHPFQKAGLGLAPFKFVGYEERRGPMPLGDGISMIGSPGQPMGTCDYCGTGIAGCYMVKSADGKHFIVGCDCVQKLSKASNAKQDPAIAAILRAANDIKTKKRHEREKAQIAELTEFCMAHSDVLAGMSHTSKYWAEQGQTALDELNWFLKNAGTAGSIKMLKASKKRIELNG